MTNINLTIAEGNLYRAELIRAKAAALQSAGDSRGASKLRAWANNTGRLALRQICREYNLRSGL